MTKGTLQVSSSFFKYRRDDEEIARIFAIILQSVFLFWYDSTILHWDKSLIKNVQLPNWICYWVGSWTICPLPNNSHIPFSSLTLSLKELSERSLRGGNSSGCESSGGGCPRGNLWGPGDIVNFEVVLSFIELWFLSIKRDKLLQISILLLHLVKCFNVFLKYFLIRNKLQSEVKFAYDGLWTTIYHTFIPMYAHVTTRKVCFTIGSTVIPEIKAMQNRIFAYIFHFKVTRRKSGYLCSCFSLYLSILQILCVLCLFKSLYLFMNIPHQQFAVSRFFCEFYNALINY